MRREQVGVIVVAVGSLLLLALAGASVPFEPPPDEDIRSPDEPPEDDEPREENGEERRNELSSAPIISIGLAVAITALLAYWLLFGSRSTEPAVPTSPPPVDRPDGDETPLEAVAAAAGEAVDRIRQTDSFENEVYRAWWEMTRAMAVSKPRTKTPGEFARAATRAGMEQEDVRELTDLFNDVRYGDRELTQDDEGRAVSILESIEAAYRRRPS